MKFSWDKLQALIFLATIIFISGETYSHAADLEARVSKLEAAFIMVPSTLARIEQKVDCLSGDCNGIGRPNKTH